MRKFLFTFSLLALCAYSGRTVAQTESTSSATITFFRTPSSLLPGKFSVAADKQVGFSRGNLQYLASQKIWRFAEHQYDIVGNAAGNTTASAYRSTQAYWIDFFGWGSSGYKSSSGATAFQPWAVSTDNTHYCPNVSSGASWTGDYAHCDFGIHNFTSSLDEGYRVLTADEWNYLLTTRVGTYDSNDASTLKGAGKLFGMPGWFLLPDDWRWANVEDERAAADFTWVGNNVYYNVNVIADNASGHALWSAMEANGAVFLPAAGYREGVEVKTVGESLYYHTATSASSTEGMRSLVFEKSGATALYVGTSGRRMIGRSVRLAKDY